MDFILENLPIILCYLVGTGLLVLEIFLPGFGIAGVSGIVLELACIFLAWYLHNAVVALGVAVFCLATMAIALSIAFRSVSKGRLDKTNLVLSHAENTDNGYSTSETDLDVFLNKEGVTKTVLRPAGIAEFEGVRLDVVSAGEFIGQNQRVRIEKIEGARILVKVI